MGPATIWVAAVVLAGLAALAVLAGRGGPSDFEIRSGRGGRVVVRGRIPRAKVGAIREFFGSDLGLSGPAAVRGSFGPNRAIRLEFSGPLTAGQRQRARNFLVDHLR